MGLSSEVDEGWVGGSWRVEMGGKGSGGGMGEGGGRVVSTLRASLSGICQDVVNQCLEFELFQNPPARLHPFSFCLLYPKRP